MTAPELNATATTARVTQAKRDPRLEGIRGYLAIGVMVFHVAFTAKISSFLDEYPAGIWTTLVDGLSVCLPPFFVLSGWFLYRPFVRSALAGTPRPRAGSFISGRLLRLLPAYWLLLAVALPAFTYDRIDGIWYVLRPLLMIHFYWPPNEPWIIGIEPTWTVPTEILFYLSLPILAVIGAAAARRGGTVLQRARRSLVSVALLGGIGLAWQVYVLLPSQQMTVASYNLWYWPFAYYTAFAVGMLLATLSAYADVTGRQPAIHRFVRRHPLVLWGGATVAYLLNLPKTFGDLGVGTTGAMIQSHVQTLFVLAFAALVIAPLTVPGVQSRFMDLVLANPVMRYLGRISYGIYLWHIAAIYLVLRQGSMFGNVPKTGPMSRGLMDFWPLMTLTLLTSVAIATVSYYALERPIARWRYRRNLAADGRVPVVDSNHVPHPPELARHGVPDARTDNADAPVSPAPAGRRPDRSTL